MNIFPAIPDDLIDRIKLCRKAVVCGHMSPDGDCANSVMAMGELLKALGKDCILVNDGPFLDSNIGPLKDLIQEDIEEEMIDDSTLGIVVDCSTIDRLGKYQDLFRKLDSIVIDHHASGVAFGLARYIVPKSPSTTLLIQRLFNAMNIPLDLKTATMLFRGFITDSGYFRFLSKDSEDVFSAVADLVSYGVSPDYEYSLMTGGQPRQILQFLGKLLERTEYYYDNKLIITHEEDEDFLKFNCATPTNEFYQHALTVENSSVVVSLKISKKQEGAVEVGFRSRHDSPVDVGKLAFEFGGGGHSHAAGATIKGNMNNVKELIINAIGKQL